jgi:hypothetical protein
LSQQTDQNDDECFLVYRDVSNERSELGVIKEFGSMNEFSFHCFANSQLKSFLFFETNQHGDFFRSNNVSSFSSSSKRGGVLPELDGICGSDGSGRGHELSFRVEDSIVPMLPRTPLLAIPAHVAGSRTLASSHSLVRQRPSSYSVVDSQ